MQVFADDGACIDVSVDGVQRAPVVVMIHGFPLTRAVWQVHGDELAQTYRVLRIDLRGAGSSSVPEGPYLMERLAADVAAALDALNIERAAMIGHSMGGYVALAFARMFTERITRLALVAGRLRADTPGEAAARRELADRVERAGTPEPAIAAYLPRLFGSQSATARPHVVERAHEIARANSAAGVAATLRGMALRASSEDIVSDLDIPMLTIAGASDRVVQMDEARDIARRFPRGRLVVCEQSGHLPMLEEPERVSDALRAWLSE
ncbi:MAG: alpha/beta fold hydrolase [Candidatus Eremiobacteraeota bacterium]|nr:alpha/beta fold hydrolase [Candidatus Eremiobacteraeota bacterium]